MPPHYLEASPFSVFLLRPVDVIDEPRQNRWFKPGEPPSTTNSHAAPAPSKFDHESGYVSGPVHRTASTVAAFQ
jgi:hypothetical protein